MADVISLRDHVTNGLIPDSRMNRGVPFLQNCSGDKDIKYGIRATSPVLQVIADAQLLQATHGGTADIVMEFPFPQLFRGRGVTLLVDDFYVFEVDESDWTITPLVTYDVYTETFYSGGDHYLLPNSPLSGWQFIDMHDSWWLINDSCKVMKSKWQDSTKVFVDDTQTILTGCTFKGRLITGGFDVSDYYSADWLTYWSSLLTRAKEFGFDVPSASIAPGQNWVQWSAIGGGDTFNFKGASDDPSRRGLFSSEGLGTTPLVADSENFFLDQLRLHQMGFLVMDWQGLVLRVLPLGNKVMVYGSDGISAIFPTAEPVPTFGLIDDVLQMGIHSGVSVASGGGRHVFLDFHGALWSIDGNLSVTRIDYSSHIQRRTDDAVNDRVDIYINYDPMYDDFYISTDSRCYVLSDNRLSETGFLISSLLQRGSKITIADGTALAATTLKSMPFTEYVENGAFASGSNWALTGSFAIGGGSCNMTGTGTLSQSNINARIPVKEFTPYQLIYDCTFSSGNIVPRIGGTAGTTRSTTGTDITETIICGSTENLSFIGTGANGTIDNVRVTQVGSYIRTIKMHSNRAGMMTINKVQLIAVDYTNLRVAIEYTLEGATDSLTRTDPLYTVDSRGFASIDPILVSDFRIVIISLDKTALFIDDILVYTAEQVAPLKTHLS